MSLQQDTELEKHLLSRCYDSQSKIVELLQDRYSVTGSQKSTILFKNIVTDTKKPRSLLHQENTQPTKITQERKKTTRQVLREYISGTLNNQRKLIKKIQSHNRKNTTGHQPFPIHQYLQKYKSPNFDDFFQMNKLWQKYAQDLIFQNGNLMQSLSSILPRLTAADFNGCLLTVLQSRNTNVIGTRGIVVWDAQHSFILVVPRNEDSKEWNEEKSRFSPSEMVGGLKVIPKKHTMFGFDIIDPRNENDCYGFTIVGSRFEIRSVERSGKKFKNHSVDDIL